MRIIITGGHHNSAVPVINKLREIMPKIEIFWVGHRHSLKNDKNDTLEYLEITSMGIPFYELKAGKFYRTYDLSRLIRIPLGFIQSLFYLLKVRPNLIVSFGGYLAAPVVIAGKFLGIPSITHEQTLVAGYSNRLIANFADKVLISWEESRSYFPKDKTVFVGLPLRSSIFVNSSNSFNFDNNFPIIFVLAGKTGSLFINELIKNALTQLLDRYNVVHQSGDYSEGNCFSTLSTYYASIKDNYKGKYVVKKFIFEDEIGEIYSKASLVVARSGAHTVSELLALNKPAILIPIPWVSHNEQYKNAEMLKNNDLAQIIQEKDASSYVLVKKIDEMFATLSKYTRANSYKVEQNPVDLIINEILKYKK